MRSATTERKAREAGKQLAEAISGGKVDHFMDHRAADEAAAAQNAKRRRERGDDARVAELLRSDQMRAPCQMCGSLDVDLALDEAPMRVTAMAICRSCGAAEKREATAPRLDLWRFTEYGFGFYFTTIEGDETIVKALAIESISMRRFLDHDQIDISTPGGWFHLKVADGPVLVRAFRDMMDGE